MSNNTQQQTPSNLEGRNVHQKSNLLSDQSVQKQSSQSKDVLQHLLSNPASGATAAGILPPYHAIIPENSMEASLPSNSRNCSAYIEESGAQTSKPSKENAKSSHEMERSSQRKHELTGTIERDRRFTCTSRNGKNLSRNMKTNSDQGASVGGRAVAGLEGTSQQLQILSSN